MRECVCVEHFGISKCMGGGGGNFNAKLPIARNLTAKHV